jgi:hypothetical protein
MEIKIIENTGNIIAILDSNRIEINDAQDALNLIGNSSYQGASGVIIKKENLTPDFFDLKNGIAGEILQKFSNYRMRLAIVGDFSAYTGISLRDFIYESNNSGRINFVGSLEEAIEKLKSF